MSNLMLCRTALQVMIAKRIIDFNQRETFHIVYIKDSLNGSNYGVETIIKKNSLIDFFRILRCFHREKPKAIYIASVNNFVFQLLLKISLVNRIVTFDDGSANLICNSFFYSRSNIKDNVKYLVFNKLLRCPTASEILYFSHWHYTIFPTLERRTTYLTLFDLSESSDLGFKSETITLFIGSCYTEVTNESSLLIEQLKKKLACYDKYIYIAHPRNKDFLQTFVPKANFNGLSEDFIIGLARKFRSVNVIGCLSTLHLNLYNVSNVNLIVLTSELIHKKYLPDSHLKEKFYKITFEHLS